MDLTQQEIAAAAQQQDAMKQAEAQTRALVQQMSLVTQFVDAAVRLFVPYPQLQSDVYSSLAAGQSVRDGLKDEQFVSSFRTKCMYARRAQKLNDKLSAEVPESIPDDVASQIAQVSATGPDGEKLALKIVDANGNTLRADDAVGPGAQPHDDAELETAPLKVSIDVASGKVTDVSDSPIIKP